MSAMWPLSRIPQFDANGDPMVGAQAFFYNVGTTTPQTTYSESTLSTTSTVDGDGAVVSDANGRFPAIFLSTNPGTYRQRVLDPDGVVLFDDDGVSVPQAADYVPPSVGSTDPTLLFTTGDYKHKHSTGTEAGWVRAAGRTIGSASSGATERANADTEDLFLHLWTQDSTLSVSGGRGVSAASDWGANKTIALPNLRGYGLVGLADMGNTAATTLAGVTVDNSETVTTLGATLGASTYALTSAENGPHTHTGTTASNGAHTHTVNISTGDGPDVIPAGGPNTIAGTHTTSSNGAHTHTFTTAASGSGTAHPNVQPSALVTIYIKL